MGRGRYHQREGHPHPHHPSPAHTALCRQEHLKLDIYQLVTVSASVNESDEQEADRNISTKRSKSD